MHNFWVVAAAAVLVCGEALAAEGRRPKTGKRRSVLAFSATHRQQAEQFVSLRGKGAAPKSNAGCEQRCA